MPATYPINRLPYPVRDNHKVEYLEKQRSRKMDDGTTANRRRFELQPQKLTLTWMMTWEEFEFFEAFLRYDCGQGALEFDIPLAPGATARTVRFMAYPSSTFDEQRGEWTVSGQVETYKYGQPTGIRLAYAKVGYVKPGYWVEVQPEMMNGYPAFPSIIPEPEKSGYGIERPNEFVRSNVDEGKASERARFSNSVVEYNCKWILTAAQKEAFEDFVYNVIYGGAAPFYAPFANGSGLNYTRSQFITLPVITPVGSAFQAEGRLQSAAIPMMSEAEYRS